MIIIQRIAVLLTCYNRRDKTLNCLNALFHAFLPEVYYIKVFLVDDGSTDGTSEAVRKMFPDVKVIQGNGNLYWNRGMHLAWTTAAKTNKYDFYLWLNDDTILFHSSLLDLVETANKTSCKAIIVGSTVSKNTGKLTYGGMLLSNSNLLKPNENIQNCDYFNGNIVLIPKSVYNVIGPNDPFFHHSLGDLDYGLRANKKNIKSFICSNVQGFCEINNQSPIWWSTKVGLFKRIKSLFSPLSYSHPIEHWIFDIRHKNILTALYHQFLIFSRLLFPKKYLQLKNKYVQSV